MNERRGVMYLITTKNCFFPLFFQGFVPAWVRLAPHTILTWIFLEQLRVFFPIKQQE